MYQIFRFAKWILLIALLSISLSSCLPREETRSNPLTPTPDATLKTDPTSTLSPAALRVHPSDTRVGIEQIDRVLAAVLAGRTAELIQVVAFTTTACTNADGLGGPPKCRADEVEGTTVEVLPFLGPEGHYLRAAEISEWSGLDIAGLFAIYRNSEKVYSEEYFPAGEYSILLIGTQDWVDYNLRIDERGIVRVDNILGGNPQAELERDAGEVILPPPAQ